MYQSKNLTIYAKLLGLLEKRSEVVGDMFIEVCKMDLITDADNQAFDKISEFLRGELNRIAEEREHVLQEQEAEIARLRTMSN